MRHWLSADPTRHTPTPSTRTDDVLAGVALGVFTTTLLVLAALLTP
jgi:hypothetical protein